MVELDYHRCWYDSYFRRYHISYSMAAPEGAIMILVAVMANAGLFIVKSVGNCSPAGKGLEA
jgi:hypothetical protein